MIFRKDIEALIKNIELFYNIYPDPIMATYFSKLAIIEICGWIEESFDKIAHRAVLGKIRTITYLDILKNRIEKNFGFDYKKNFRKMMIQIIGVVEMEKLETELVRDRYYDTLTSTLEALKSERDLAAHTTIAGAMPSYQAPNITLNQFQDLYPIFRKIYSFVIKLNSSY